MMKSVFRVLLTAAVVVAAPAIAAAQPSNTIPDNVRATAAAPSDNTGWGGTLNLGVQTSDGTQQQNAFTAFTTAFYETGRQPSRLHVNTRGRFELDFRNGKKPNQARVTSTDMRYGEFRIAANARQ